MIGPLAGAGEILPGPGDFVLLHEGTMPQKDQLCGAFWGALTLSATLRARRRSRSGQGRLWRRGTLRHGCHRAPHPGQITRQLSQSRPTWLPRGHQRRGSQGLSRITPGVRWSWFP